MAVALLTTLASAGRWTWLLDQAVYDLAQRTWSRAPPDDVVIVAIDEASLAAIGRWPWNRSIHAEAIRRINQAGAKSILLNLLLSEAESEPAQDQALARALKDAGNVVLPEGLLSHGPGKGQIVRPIQLLAKEGRIAHADALLDADGTLRRAVLWTSHGQVSRPHPAVALLAIAGQAPASLSARHRDALPVLIPFIGAPGHVRQVSYADLLRGQLDPGTFKNKHVLIGATAIGLGDTFQTPVSADGQGMSGVEVIGQWLSSLQHDRQVHSLPATWHAVTSAVLVLGLMMAYTRLAPRRALLLALGVATLALGLAWALLAADLWWPPCSVALGAVLSYPVWSWHKLETTARALEAELKQLSADPGVHSSWPNSESHSATRSDFMGQRTDAISQASQQLRQARQVLARTLAALPDAVFVFDAQRHVTQANEQAGRMTGIVPADKLLGQRLEDVLTAWTPNEAPDWGLLFMRARQTGQAQHSEATHPAGRQYLVSLVAVDSDLAEQDAEVIVCATDVTALRQAELQRSELLGFIAHDIRAPQASLVSLVELHRIGGKLSHDETLAHVEAMARHSLELCEELLQVMRAETRPINLTAGDLAEMADGCMAQMSMLAKAKGITLHAGWLAHTPIQAVFDDYLLHRALNNLLSNAIKFSPQGGLVSVALHEEPGYHVLSVRDQGPGIPESELGRLFKRYERVEQGRPSKLAAGIGLGLVFIDTVARRHGGHVKVINRPGEGACFELWLPALGIHPSASVQPAIGAH